MIKKATSFMQAFNNVAKMSNQEIEQGVAGSDSLVSSIVANMCQEEQTSENVQAVVTSLRETYYNKFKNGNRIQEAESVAEDYEFILDEDAFYVVVANGQPEDKIDRVSIGNLIFTKDDRKKFLSIGMNAFIYANVWKVNAEKKLLVAVPWLFAMADEKTGNCTVNANGIVYNVPVMEPVVEGAGLSISKYQVTQKEGFTGTITKDNNTFRVKAGHYTQALCLTLSSNGTELLDQTLTMFTIDQNMNMAMVSPETLAGIKSTYAFYFFPWKNEPVTTPISREYDKTLVIPGYGVVSFKVEATGVVNV